MGNVFHLWCIDLKDLICRFLLRWLLCDKGLTYGLCFDERKRYLGNRQIPGKRYLDLLILKGGQKLGYEFKFSDSLGVTKSARSAIENLSLDHLTIIFPGNKIYTLEDNVTAMGLAHLKSAKE